MADFWVWRCDVVTGPSSDILLTSLLTAQPCSMQFCPDCMEALCSCEEVVIHARVRLSNDTAIWGPPTLLLCLVPQAGI